MKPKTEPLVLFHDGKCPLCQAEVLLLKHRSKHGQIEFVDVHDTAFDSACEGVSRDRALAVLHGRIGDGPLLRGVDVFTGAYQRAGFHVATRILTQRWLRPFLNTGYRLFAAYRKSISRLVGPLALWLVQRRYRQRPAIEQRPGSE